MMDDHILGQVASLWRYPVKSMRGENLNTAFIGYSGVYGDRLYAFKSSKSPDFFPYLTGRDTQDMLCYTPRFRSADAAQQPVSWAVAEATSVGITPLYPEPENMMLDVETPNGESFAINDPGLCRQLQASAGEDHQVSLTHSARAMTDCRPLSLISEQTVTQLSEESGIAIDPRRFRANLYLSLKSPDSKQTGFAEDSLVGQTLKIGPKVIISIVEKDPRCEMVMFDPDTGESNPAILRNITQAHQRNAGVYAAVLVEGMVTSGDSITLIA